MITKYVSEIIRVFVNSGLFPKEELQDTLCMSDEAMTGLLEGSDNYLDLNNVECFTTVFGMEALNYTFLSEVMTDTYRNSEVHGSLSTNNSDLKDRLGKLWAISGEKNHGFQRNLGRLASNKCYINSCQLMLDALRDAGVMEHVETDETEEDNDSED